MANAARRTSLSRGIPVKVVDAISAAGSGDWFSLPANPASDGLVTFVCKTQPVTFDGNIEMSDDGGTTWHTFIGFDFGSGTSSPVSATFQLPAGLLFRFTIVNVSAAADVTATLG